MRTLRVLVYCLAVGSLLSMGVPATAQVLSAGPAIYEGARLILGDGAAPIEVGAFVVQDGRITAIDLRNGEHAWMVPNGDGPRDHPRLRHLDLPPLGQQGRAAPLLTKTLLFIGEGDPIIISTPRGAGGTKFRAYDKATGSVLWETELPSGTTGAPMTYMFNGRQYVVVAIGGRGHPAEWVALGLP